MEMKDWHLGAIRVFEEKASIDVLGNENEADPTKEGEINEKAGRRDGLQGRSTRRLHGGEFRLSDEYLNSALIPFGA